MNKETISPPEGSEVKCVYCGQIMGWAWDERIARGIEKILLESHELSAICDKAPDGQHANMTPEQAEEAILYWFESTKR